MGSALCEGTVWWLPRSQSCALPLKSYAHHLRWVLDRPTMSTSCWPVTPMAWVSVALVPVLVGGNREDLTLSAGTYCENTRAAWLLFFTARTWAKPHRFYSSVTLLLRRVVQSKTQWHSNVLKLLKLLQKSSQASKTFFQLLQIKRLQLKLTNNLQNSYQISSQHQVPKTWVKQHPKTPKTTKTNENPSPSSSMHKLVPFGSKLVPTWFL